jgi:hypothetical protein
MGYSLPGAPTRFPLDADLNPSADKYSHGLMCRVAEEAANNSFDHAVATICKTTGGKVPKRQAEEMVVAVARDFDSFYSNREAETPEQAPDILVLSVDQKGVVMHKEDLRPATRKAAEETVQHPDARLTPGEKRNRKRMATVATVYSIEAHERTPETIMCLERENKPVRPRGTNKRVWASLERQPEEVIRAMFDEALRRDPEKKRTWAVLVDGAEKQLDLVLGFVLQYGAEVHLILDFIHVLEYVWKAAYSFCSVGSKDAEEWVAEMRLSATAHRLSKDKSKAVEKCADYLQKYDTLLDYDIFLKKGLPIASGAIEGACRHLIKDRMDLTGARWRLQRAEAVLRIRSLKSSGGKRSQGRHFQKISDLGLTSC